MNLSKKDLIEVLMIEYLGNIIDKFPDETKSIAATPVADLIFHIRENSEAKFLPEEYAVAFHHKVLQLLYVCTRARRDI